MITIPYFADRPKGIVPVSLYNGCTFFFYNKVLIAIIYEGHLYRGDVFRNIPTTVTGWLIGLSTICDWLSARDFREKVDSLMHYEWPQLNNVSVTLSGVHVRGLVVLMLVSFNHDVTGLFFYNRNLIGFHFLFSDTVHFDIGCRIDVINRLSEEWGREYSLSDTLDVECNNELRRLYADDTAITR